MLLRRYVWWQDVPVGGGRILRFSGRAWTRGQCRRRRRRALRWRRVA